MSSVGEAIKKNKGFGGFKEYLKRIKRKAQRKLTTGGSREKNKYESRNHLFNL